MERELVEKLQKGNIKAFDGLFDKYANRLYAFCFKHLRSKEDAEDMVQNVFLKIWKNRKYLKNHTSLQSFLFTIAYHDICNIFRKRVNQRKFNESLSINEPVQDDGLDYKLVLEQVDRLISQLPEKQKAVFIKSRKENLSSKQIAQEFNISPGTVDNYISSALKFLRSKLSKESLLILSMTSMIFS